MLSIGVVKVVFVFDVLKKWNSPWTDDPFSQKFEFSAVVLNLSRESLEIYPGKQQKGEHRSIWLRWRINNCVVRAKTRKNVILLSILHNDKAIDPDSGDSNKPEVITFCNSTERGEDTVEKMYSTFNVDSTVGQ